MSNLLADILLVLHASFVAFVVSGLVLVIVGKTLSWREKGGSEGYEGTFISHWLGELLYYEAPAWLFVLVYTVFGMLVVITWFWVRPR